MRSLILFCISISHFTTTLASNPRFVQWNTTSYGPDGPWPVVTAQVGLRNDNDPLAYVDLHPGAQYGSKLLTSQFCAASGACPAKRAGLYDANASTTAIQNYTDEGGVIYDWDSDKTWNNTGVSVNVVDSMQVPSAQGIIDAYNSSITAIDSWQIQLPGGTNYSVQVGIMSLGCPDDGYEGWTNVDGGDSDIQSQAFQGPLLDNRDIESNTFGLHYGSVSLGLKPSLVFGGYDQSRVLGTTGSFDMGEDKTMTTSLLDVEIGVESGSSPFANSSSFPGLLKLDSTAVNGGQTLSVNPAVPYLFMSPATCTAITANLPVTLNADVGLYTWNTQDPQYQTILQSAAYLAFIFQNTGTGNITIKVPFQLLNLTLEAPIVETTQQYFPCRPHTTTEGQAVLGRAFLQAAYVGANWNVLKWFIGQAPGPNVGASNVRTLGQNDSTVSSDPIANFATTWAKEWKTQSGNDTSGSSGPSADDSDGLSTGAKAGIGIGVALGILAVIAAAAILFLRRRKRSVPREEQRMLGPSHGEYYDKDGQQQLGAAPGVYHEKDAQQQPGSSPAYHEKDATHPHQPPLELGGDSTRHEPATADNEVYEMGVRRNSTDG